MAITKAKHIVVIIPAYNEAKVIGDVLATIPRKIQKLPVSIVVVNDGSSDNTVQIVSKHRDVLLINHLLNSGAGAATRTGLRYAREAGYDYAVTMDADGQHSPADVEKLVKQALKNEADFIIGSRLIESKGMPRHRIIGNKGLSLITFLIFGVFVTDSQSGLKILNKTALEKIDYHSSTFAFCSEMVWRAKKERLRIKELPIEAIYTDYSLTKGQSNWGAVAIIKTIIKRRLMEFING